MTRAMSATNPRTLSALDAVRSRIRACELWFSLHHVVNRAFATTHVYSSFKAMNLGGVFLLCVTARCWMDVLFVNRMSVVLVANGSKY